MKDITTKDLIAVAYVDNNVNKMQQYFRSFELQDDDDLFTITTKVDTINKLKVSVYIDATDNESVNSVKDFEYIIKGKNAVIEMLREELYYVILKTEVIVKVNVKTNYIGVSMWDESSLYGSDIIYVAPKGSKASLFIRELKNQIKNFEKEGIKK